MPDMQTEVRKIIDSWASPEIEQETTPAVAKSFPEQVFDYIKANPKCSLKKIREALVKGEKDDSPLTNTLKNLYDRQLIGRVAIDNPDFKGFGRRLVFVYWAVANQYVTHVQKRRGRPKGKVTKLVAKKKAASVAGIDKLLDRRPEKPDRSAKIEVQRSTTNPQIQGIINGLTVYGAKELWKELNEVFGK